jgi:hypothetical protein
MDAHEAFDQMRVATGLNRGRAYKWLREKMGMTREECHMGKFDIPTCERVISICEGEAERLGFGDPWAKDPAKPDE